MKELSDSDGRGTPTDTTPATPPAPTTQSENVPPPSPAPTPEPPAVTEIVIKGEHTEAEMQLARELEAERVARKKAEMDAAQLQDELHRVTTPPAKQEQPVKRGPFGVRTR